MPPGYIYLRVSSQKQLGAGHVSMKFQEEECLELMKKESFTYGGTFEDKGISGRRSTNRAKLQEVLALLKKGSGLFIYSLNRLSRDSERRRI